MPSHRPGARTPQWPVGYFLRREGLPALPAPVLVTPTVVGAGLVMCASAGLVTVVLTGQQQHTAGRTAAGDRLMTGPAEPSNVVRTASQGVTSAPETAAAPVAPPTVVAQPTPGYSDYSDVGGARRGGVPGSPDGPLPEAWRSPKAVEPAPVPPPPQPQPQPPPPPPARAQASGPGRQVGSDGVGRPGLSERRSAPDRPAVDRDSGRSEADLGLGAGSGPVRRGGTESASGGSDREDLDQRDSDGRDSDTKKSDKKKASEKDDEKASDKKESDKKKSAKDSKKDSDEKDSDEKDSDEKDSDEKDSDEKDSDEKDSETEDESDDKAEQDDDGKDTDCEKPRSDCEDDRRGDHRRAGDDARIEAARIEAAGTERDGTIRVTALADHRRIEPGFSWFDEATRTRPAPARPGAHARPAHAAPAVWSPELAVHIGRSQHHRPAHAAAS